MTHRNHLSLPVYQNLQRLHPAPSHKTGSHHIFLRFRIWKNQGCTSVHLLQSPDSPDCRFHFPTRLYNSSRIPEYPHRSWMRIPSLPHPSPYSYTSILHLSIYLSPGNLPQLSVSPAYQFVDYRLRYTPIPALSSHQSLLPIPSIHIP